MDRLLIFTTAFVVGLSGALMPGPVTAVAVQQTLKRGLLAAPLVTLGHGLMEALVVVLLVFGLGSLMAAPGVTGVIGIAGGAMLAWMGRGMIVSARSASLTLSGNGGNADITAGPGAVPAGILATLSNPYWFLWWATVGAGYVAFSQRHGPAGVLLFLGGHILADLSWLLVIALLLVTGRKYVSDRIYSGAFAVLGFFLLGLAAYFFWTGLNFLL